MGSDNGKALRHLQEGLHEWTAAERKRVGVLCTRTRGVGDCRVGSCQVNTAI